MKTTMKAAVLLLSGTIFFSQASLADRPDNKPPPKDGCTLVVSNPDAACTTEIKNASIWLGNAKKVGVFDTKNGDNNYLGLTCKLALSQDKMEQEKAEDAWNKLWAAAAKLKELTGSIKPKIDTSGIRGKVVKVLQSYLNKAESCAYKVAFPE